MKLLNLLKICCFFVLFNLSANAVNSENILVCEPEVNNCTYVNAVSSEKKAFGVSGRGNAGPDQWYTIETNSYPVTTPLSLNRNVGDSEGALYLSPTGFTVGAEGDYLVTISAVLQNPSEESIFLIPVFLVLDEVFNPEDPLQVGGVVTLPSDEINTLQGTGIIRNVPAGTRLSLVATNSGYETPIPVTVAAWSITAVKL